MDLSKEFDTINRDLGKVKGWATQWFEHGTPVLGIQCLNYWVIVQTYNSNVCYVNEGIICRFAKFSKKLTFLPKVTKK